MKKIGFVRDDKGVPKLILGDKELKEDSKDWKNLSEIKVRLDLEAKRQYEERIKENKKIAESLSSKLLSIATRLSKGYDSTNIASLFDERKKVDNKLFEERLAKEISKNGMLPLAKKISVEKMSAVQVSELEKKVSKQSDLQNKTLELIDEMFKY